MTLAATGYISLADNPSNRQYSDNRVVNLELGYAANATIVHPSSDTRNLTGVSSGALRLPDDYWNKTATFTFNLPAGANVDFRTAALNAGWNGIYFVIGTLPSGNVITSADIGTAGLTISGSFPRGVKFINQSIIYGAGGYGGTGSCGYNSGGPGANGGTALYVSVSCQVDNALGELRGGGGGGGGGGGNLYKGIYTYGGGGGGGGGYNAGNGSYYGCSYTPGTNGTNGGGGGAGGAGSAAGYAGGNGGSQGSGGSNGSTAGNQAAGSGGAAGSATQGSGSYITWVGAGYGTRVGPVN